MPFVPVYYAYKAMLSFLRSLFSTRVLSLLVPELILIFSCYIFAAYWSAGADPSVFLLYDNGLLQVAIVAAGVLTGMQLNKLYFQVGVRSKILLIQQLCLALGVTFLLESLLSYSHSYDLVLSPTIMLMGSAAVLAVLLVWRIFYSAVLWKNFGGKRLLFYGTSAAVLEASRTMAAHPELGLDTVGYIDNAELAGTQLQGAPVMTSANLQQAVSQLRPDRIVISATGERGGLPFEKLLDLQFRGIEMQPVRELYEGVCERVCLSELRPSQVIFAGELGSRRGAMALQAVYSNLLALGGLALLALLAAPVALAIALSCRAPVIEAHPRLGLNMMPFTQLRFRCRRLDGRDTTVGRWLRRLRLDGLPQLVNVIRGEMALVGPRAHRPEFIPILMAQIPYYGQRHAVRPGILGWSQLNCESRNVPDAIEALEYDLYYIKHASPALDANIILHSLMGSPFR
jgi:lipopolysaccharide/colanic/teichoic acid biosynthesis glycosyltransferase